MQSETLFFVSIDAVVKFYFTSRAGKEKGWSTGNNHTVAICGEMDKMKGGRKEGRKEKFQATSPENTYQIHSQKSKSNSQRNWSSFGIPNLFKEF